MRRAGHVARIGGMTNVYKICRKKIHGKTHLRNLGVYGNTILARI
jgi:hypothetical protein